ncbi:MAG: MaoC family dehydratase [Lysobacterales bacterium]
MSQTAAREIHFSDVAAQKGQELGVSDWLNIDQSRVNDFANATIDHQWIHIDQERASKEMGGTIVHGFLTLSLLVHLHDQVVSWAGHSKLINYGCNKVRFTGMVPVGSNIRLRLSVSDVAPKGGGLLVTETCVIEVEGQERPALVAEWLTVLFPEE